MIAPHSRPTKFTLQDFAMTLLTSVSMANEGLFQQALDNAQDTAPAPDKIISGFPEYQTDLTSDQNAQLSLLAQKIVESQSSAHPISAAVISGYADRDLRPNNPNRKPGETQEQFEMRVSMDRAIAARDLLKAKISALAAGRGPSPILDAILADPRRLKTVGMGAKDLLVQNPRTESDRRLNRRVEIILVSTVQPAPPPAADPFSARVRRAARLIEGGKKVDPDSTGTRTKRAYGFLQQMLLPNVNDKFVDGEKSNETVNGKRALDERGMPTALCGYPGKYDPPEVNAADFEKFFDHAFPILKGPGWAPGESDERILQILGALVLRIDQGINLTDEYIAHNVELIAGGYMGDQARKKLQQEYVRRMNDSNDIYWPFRSRL